MPRKSFTVSEILRIVSPLLNLLAHYPYSHLRTPSGLSQISSFVPPSQDYLLFGLHSLSFQLTGEEEGIALCKMTQKQINTLSVGV